MSATVNRSSLHAVVRRFNEGFRTGVEIEVAGRRLRVGWFKKPHATLWHFGTGRKRNAWIFAPPGAWQARLGRVAVAYEPKAPNKQIYDSNQMPYREK